MPIAYMYMYTIFFLNYVLSVRIISDLKNKAYGLVWSDVFTFNVQYTFEYNFVVVVSRSWLMND